MRILLLSYHFGSPTAEGLMTRRLAGALADRGHRVTALVAEEAPAPAGVAVEHLPPESATVPGWRLALDRRASRHHGWDRLASALNVFAGGPARERAWTQAAARHAAGLLVQNPVDVVHSRLNPVASHLAALELCRQQASLPWCAYFSDPWPHHLYPPPYAFTVGPVSRRRLEGLLAAILSRADRLVFPASRLQDYLLRGRRERFRAKSRVIPHLAPDVPQTPTPPAASRHLRIRHSGFLMKERRIEPLLEALKLLVERNPGLRHDLRIEFAGRYPGGVTPEAPSGWDDVLAFRPWMPPDEAQAWLDQADVWLLVEACLAEGIFFPSKLAEYLVGGRPILAISPRTGVAADHLGPGGLVAPPDEPASIASALQRLHDLWRGGGLSRLAPDELRSSAVRPEAVMPLYETAFAEAREAAA